MAAITPWTLGLEAMANKASQPASASKPAYKPAYTNSLTVAAQQAAEAEAKRQAVAEAEAAEAASVAERHANTITNLYGGGEGSRVLSQEEINTGWTDALGRYHGPAYQETRSEEELAEIRHRNLSHDWYESGMDSFVGSTPVGQTSFSDNIDVFGNHDIYNEALRHVRGLMGTPDDQGTITPWINTFHNDKFNTYNYVRDADYNAFLGTFGGKQSDYDDYRADSIAGWFKNAFAGDDQVKNRASALRDINSLDGNISKSSDVMTKQYFDQLDLANKYGLTWEQAGAVIDANTPNNGGSNNLPGTGMLTNQESSWQDVVNRGGASLENWDSLLGQYTYNTPLDWASMDNATVESSFGELFDNGGMFTQGKNRDLIYAKLMENLGRG